VDPLSPLEGQPTLSSQFQALTGAKYRRRPPAVLRKEALNPPLQLPVLREAGTLGALPPGVVARPRHAVHPSELFTPLPSLGPAGCLARRLICREVDKRVRFSDLGALYCRHPYRAPAKKNESAGLVPVDPFDAF